LDDIDAEGQVSLLDHIQNLSDDSGTLNDSVNAIGNLVGRAVMAHTVSQLMNRDAAGAQASIANLQKVSGLLGIPSDTMQTATDGLQQIAAAKNPQEAADQLQAFKDNMGDVQSEGLNILNGASLVLAFPGLWGEVRDFKDADLEDKFSTFGDLVGAAGDDGGFMLDVLHASEAQPVLSNLLNTASGVGGIISGIMGGAEAASDFKNEHYWAGSNSLASALASTLLGLNTMPWAWVPALITGPVGLEVGAAIEVAALLSTEIHSIEQRMWFEEALADGLRGIMSDQNAHIAAHVNHHYRGLPPFVRAIAKELNQDPVALFAQVMNLDPKQLEAFRTISFRTRLPEDPSDDSADAPSTADTKAAAATAKKKPVFIAGVEEDFARIGHKVAGVGQEVGHQIGAEEERAEETVFEPLTLEEAKQRLVHKGLVTVAPSPAAPASPEAFSTEPA
jgi:hypothetical protein